jgi:hypothetical protein
MIKKGNIPSGRLPVLMIGLMAAGGMAAGYAVLKKKHDESAQKVAAMQAIQYSNRGRYRGPRNPSYAFLSSDDVTYHGNFKTRDVMRKNAIHRWNNRIGYRASIWDLEQFLR